MLDVVPAVPTPDNITVVYTDGACRGNPGPGGWAAILRSGATEKEISGGDIATTNNRMEMLAVINGLNALKALDRPAREVLNETKERIFSA